MINRTRLGVACALGAAALYGLVPTFARGAERSSPGLGNALLPLAWRCVSKRMPPEEEAAWREAEGRGQGDDWLRKQRLKKRE